MKKLQKLAVGAALSFGLLAPVLAQNVGISIGVNQPGVYGRINIGNAPPPTLVYPQPVLIAPPQQMLPRQPIYLYVPPMHQQNWSRYCNRYSACGQPVYFVQEQWVRDRYVQAHPGWRNDRWDGRRDGPGNGHGPGHGPRGRDRDHDRGDHRDGRDGRPGDHRGDRDRR